MQSVESKLQNLRKRDEAALKTQSQLASSSCQHSPPAPMPLSHTSLPSKPAISAEALTAAPMPPAAEHTPRTAHLLEILNSRDVRQIKALKGVGPKKAKAIAEGLRALKREHGGDAEEDAVLLTSLDELARLKGVGTKLVDGMRAGLGASG